MTANKSIIILIAASIIAAVFIAGCASPTPSPAVTPSPTVPPAISPGPTPTPAASDRANVTVNYVIHSSGKYYENLLPAPDGFLYYTLDVTVRSDKPVETDGTWFSIDYRRNGTDTIKNYPVSTVVVYPKTTIGNDSSPATGRLLVMLPEPQYDPYGPVPVYFKPLAQQVGPNKVYAPVYGVMRA